MTVPFLHRNRRPTTLPEITSITIKPIHTTVGAFSEAMKREFAEPIRDQLYQASLFFPQADPWDEAVKWIERREAARAEWPWPER